MKKTEYVKPLLKWVGGKTQILDNVIDIFPKEIGNYHEIFLGGGSVLLALLSCIKNNTIKVKGKINAYDVNSALVYTYKNIQTQPEKLFDEVQKIITEYNDCDDCENINRNSNNLDEAKENKENYYYWIRNNYNKSKHIEDISHSAMFIFLNKTCFRGLFRIGPNGFNVPFGHYKNPEIINKVHLLNIHELIKDVNFECCDFTDSLSLKKIKKNDFIYLDPPYVPEKNTSFVKYTENGFNEAEHKKLFKILNEMNDKNIKFLLSNADVPLVRESFTDKKYKIETILCKRSINSKKPNMKSEEVLINNF